MSKWTRYSQSLFRRISRRIKQGRSIFISLFELQEIQILNNLLTQVNVLSIKQATVDLDLLYIDYDYWDREFAEKCTPWLMGTANDAGQAMLSGLNPEAAQFSLVDPRVWDEIGERVKKFSHFINETTNERIQFMLRDAIQQGASISEMGEMIQDTFELNKTWRAELIARTETVGANNLGQMEGMRQSGIVKFHSWFTAGDAQVRDSHSIDGATVKISQDFPLGLDYSGYSRAYPSDFNERCTTFPSSVEIPDVRADIKDEAIKSWGSAETAKGIKSVFGRYYTKKKIERVFIPNKLRKKADVINTTFTDKYKVMNIIGKDKEGFQIFQMNRSFNPADRRVMYNLQVIDQRYANSGLTRQSFLNELQLYQKAGYEGVYLDAGMDVGGYAWAKYGFNYIDYKQYYSEFLKKASKVKSSIFYTMTTTQKNRWIKKMSNVAAYEFVGLRNIGGVSIENSMLGTQWSGVLNLNNLIQINIAETYCLAGL